jgi:hypothetical protein
MNVGEIYIPQTFWGRIKTAWLELRHMRLTINTLHWHNMAKAYERISIENAKHHFEALHLSKEDVDQEMQMKFNEVRRENEKLLASILRLIGENETLRQQLFERKAP